MATTRYRSKRERKQTLQPSPHSHRTESEDDRSKRDGKQTLQPSPHSHRTESEDLPYNHWKAVWSLLNSFLATWIPYLFIGTLQTLGYLLKCIMGAFVPYFVLIILIWITIGAITHRIIPYFVPAMTISPAMFMPQCPPADEDVGAFRSLVCGRIPLPVKQTWCDWGGAYVSRSFCDALVFAEQERLHEAIRTITEKTYETVDQGQRLVIRTNRLPEPRALALRSTSLHSLQWAVLYHTNFTLKQQVAEGLKVAGESLDVTVEALIELKVFRVDSESSALIRLNVVLFANRATPNPS
ncbi:hypothetical protein BC832DRAFT_292910 [Gaertneriomyces semiglobifer]|nr:hypothetical protein BC832DRAFT_292910 [Gaertneriomyces semiglobifer]